MMEIIGAAAGVVLGLLFCLAGIAVRRLWAACSGMLLGVAAGTVLGMAWQGPVGIALGGAGLGGALALLFYRFERLGELAAAGLTGWLAGLFVLHLLGSVQWPLALMGAAFSAVLTGIWRRVFLLVNLAFGGAALAVLSLFGLFTGDYWFEFRFARPFVLPETALFLFVSAVLTALLGIVVQAMLLRRRAPAEKPIFTRRHRR